MIDRLVQTKLYVPVRRPGVVERPRLDDRLNRGAQGKLTLVSAPPGFGKTTVLTNWLAGRAGAHEGVAWVSLDEGDNDPTTFWRYVAAALERAASGVGDLTLLPAADPPPATFDIGALVNELAPLPVDIVLVLDDLHVIETAQIHDALAALLDRVPPHVHVVISTRADPPLPLSRLRARGELVEIRASDLRFTPDEAAQYLNEALHLSLTAGDVAALEARTEGWIAALQLAALSMEGRDDASSFIERFAGDDRYVFDYLADEVLVRQPESVRAFLTHTAILDRLSAPLADAVTGRTDGRAMLDALDRGNLFLVALDDQRRWYRYHHLFADVLRARLFDEEPNLVAALHGRASMWFEQHGEEGEAIQHALTAGDVDRAADLIEVASRGLQQSRQEMTLRRWLDALPDRAYDARPVLADVHAGVLLATGEVRGIEARLDAAERWVDAARDDQALALAEAAGMVVRRRRALRHLPSAVALHRGGLAWVRGDADGTIVHAERALRFSGEDEPLERGGASGMLGLAYWTRGDLDAAHAAWSEAVRNLERAGSHADVLGCSIALGDIRLAQGRLAGARQVYEAGLRLATEGRTSPLRGTADMHVGLAELQLEWNDLATAQQHLEASAELGEALALPQNAYRSLVATARLCQAEGDPERAVGLLREAEQRYAADFFPEVRPIPAVRARMLIAQGQLSDARAWARDRGLSSEDELSYLREYEHFTVVRILLAAGRDGDPAASQQALDLLERLRAAAEGGRRGRGVVEALALQALAHRLLGRREEALRVLERALALAEPEGYVRLFVDEGQPMTALLGEVAKREPTATYAGRLLAAFGQAPSGVRTPQPLIEPLSERELDVLRLLTSDLDGPDIARELFVSVNTLRTHTKNIFAKLGVSSRRAAVRRASELGLLPPTAGR